MVWLIEIAMNDQLVGFLVRGKLTPGVHVYKVLVIEPLNIAGPPLTCTLNQVSSPFLQSLIKVLTLDISPTS